MRSLDFNRYAFSICVAVAILAGCGGSQPPIGAPGAMPQSPAIATHAVHGTSWMLPEAKSEDLLYVSDGSTDSVFVYSYKSRQQVGNLTGFGSPYGQCVDGTGDVWIADFRSSDVVEYAHGGTKPLKTLSVGGGSNGWPVGCSVSPNGDLAVSIGLLADAPSGAGAILVFKGASGLPVTYTDSDCYNPLAPGYDDKGNLYVEGTEYISYYMQRGNVCELPAGGTSLRVVSVRRRDHGRKRPAFGTGGVMWDGKHLALLVINKRFKSTTATAIVRAAETPSGNLIALGDTRLSDSNCNGGFQAQQVFIVGKNNTPVNHEQGTAVVGGNELPFDPCYYDFNSWSYPSGGTQQWSLTLRYTFGASVSIAKK
jgi:hypothetical protein